MPIDLLEYEFALVGAPLVDWERAQMLRGLLSADDFNDDRCAAVWRLFVAADGVQDFIVSLGQHKLSAFATGCSDGDYAMMPVMWDWVAGKVRQEARRRRVQSRLLDIKVSEGDIVAELADLVEDEQKRDAGDSMADIPSRLVADFAAELERNDLSERIMTGIKSVDSLVSGFRKGNISIIGAEPSVGKTALALNIAANSIEKGKKVVMFSLEMATVQLMERLVAAGGQVDYNEISNKYLTDAKRQYCLERARSLTDAGLLYMFDDCYLVEQMGNRIVNIKPDLVIVDFLQFCRTAERRDNTADRLEYIVSEFKRLAKLPYCRSHIMLLSQPNRQSAKEGGSMFAMKGSSGIEQGGDVILLLDRPVVRDDRFPPERANIKVAKNKFGSTGNTDIYFDGRHQLFRDVRLGDHYSQVEMKEERPQWDD